MSLRKADHGKAKHTPGPWEVKDIGGCLAVRGDANGHCIAFSNSASCSKAALRAGVSKDEEELANMRLIAAAPRMLAALNLAYAKLDDKAAKEEIGALLNEIEPSKSFATSRSANG